MLAFASDAECEDASLLNPAVLCAQSATGASSVSLDLHAFTSTQLKRSSRKGNWHDICLPTGTIIFNFFMGMLSVMLNGAKISRPRPRP